MSQVEATQQQHARSQSGQRQNSPVTQNGEEGAKRAPRGRGSSGPRRDDNGDRQYNSERRDRNRSNGDGNFRGSGRGSGPRRDGDERPRDSRTVQVDKVFLDDLDGSMEKLKDRRLFYLRQTLETFGPIETFDYNDNIVNATFLERSSAESALRAMKNKTEVYTILDNLADKMSKSKLPSAVCPAIDRYRFNWGQNPTTTRAKTASSKSAPSTNATASTNGSYKNVVAKKVDNQQQQQTATSPSTTAPVAQQKSEKPEKKNKPRKAKTEEPAETENKSDNQVAQQTPVQQEQPPVKQQDAEDLQYSAEKARLTSDLSYLRHQQHQVSQGLLAEQERCKAREDRIQKLTDELDRVKQQEQFLENQLKAEQNFKQSADDRILKLQEEVDHFVQELKTVESKMAAVDQLLKNA